MAPIDTSISLITMDVLTSMASISPIYGPSTVTFIEETSKTDFDNIDLSKLTKANWCYQCPFRVNPVT